MKRTTKCFVLIVLISFLNGAVSYAAHNKSNKIDSNVTAGNEQGWVIKEDSRVMELERQIKELQEESLQKEKDAYQLNNDRINNYVTVTGVVATIFGVILTIAGVLIALESIRSQRRKEEAIKTLEGAKKYVEDKKENFNAIVDEKTKEIVKDYNRIVEMYKEQLVNDINKQTQTVKEVAKQKAIEIEKVNIEQKSNEVIENLQKRVDFFESIGIPDDPKILFSKAKLLSEREKHEEAIELLEKAAKLSPSDSGVFWQLGWEYSKLNKHEESIGNYRECIKLQPNNASAHNNLGVELQRLDHKDYDALKEYENAIALAPKELLYYRNKAKTLEDLKSMDAALATYKQLIEMDKTKQESYQDMIRFLKENNRMNDTLEYYDQAITNVPEQKYYFNFEKADVLVKASRIEEAIGILQSLIEAKYKEIECAIMLADLKSSQAKYEEAIEIIDKIIVLDTKNPLLYYRKVDYLINLDTKKAFECAMEGFKHVHEEGFLYGIARQFASRGCFEYQKEIYTKAAEVIKPKLVNHEEGDILNYYESSIILEDYVEARSFMDSNGKYIVTPAHKLIKRFLDVILTTLEGDSHNVSSRLESILVEKDKDISIDWNFEDILNYLKSIDFQNIGLFENATKRLKEKTTNIKSND